MAVISGALLYDRERTGLSSPSMPGIAGVAVVLQNTETNQMLAVETDANGRYTFNNVPDGMYRIVEAYGTAPVNPSPGDFLRAQPGGPAAASVPPSVMRRTRQPVQPIWTQPRQIRCTFRLQAVMLRGRHKNP